MILIGAILVGLWGLAWSADRFVSASVSLAYRAGVSTLVIGLTVVAFGTSAPEILVSTIASWQGNTGLAIGNAIGSNIANIALVLGITACLYPLKFQQNLAHEFHFLLFITVIVYLLLLNQQLDYWNGWVLLGSLFAFVIWRIKTTKASAEKTEKTKQPSTNLALQLWLFLSGLLLLLLSSRLLVWGAVGIAESLQISEEVIGLSVVAIGTSLPELATSITAVRRGEHGLLIGNIIGSNLFNLLAVLGVAGIIHPTTISLAILQIDYPLMMGLTLVLFGLVYFNHIHRWQATLLLLIYFGYQLIRL